MTSDHEQISRRAIATLPSPLKTWLKARNWARLRPIQSHSVLQMAAVEAKGARHDILLSAPTAGGKTTAALMPLMARQLSQNAPTEPGFSVLYISPLKALIRQQADKEREIASLAAVVEEKQEVPFAVHPWNGDISDSRKKVAVQNPSGIMLITPESIEGRLLHDPMWLRDALAPLDAIVIDELHAYFDTPRGRHLFSILARLDALRAGRPSPVRIALSATLGDDSGPEERLNSFDQIRTLLRPDGCHPVTALTEFGVFDPGRASSASESVFDLSLNIVSEKESTPTQLAREPVAPITPEARMALEEAEEESERDAIAERHSRTLSPGEATMVEQITELFKDFGKVRNGKIVGPSSALVFANSRQMVEDMTVAFREKLPRVRFGEAWEDEVNKLRGRVIDTEVALAALREEKNHNVAEEEKLLGRLKRQQSIHSRFSDSNLFFTHHASLDAAVRHHAENRMQSESVGCVLVCTTTLELGIDVGTIENVVQIGAGASVSSLRQRLGRSRRVAQMRRLYDDPASVGAANKARKATAKKRKVKGDNPRLDIFIVERTGAADEVGLLPALRLQSFQALAQLKCLRERAFEPPGNSALDLSTLTHQILCSLKQAESAKSLTVAELREMMTVAGPFAATADTTVRAKGDMSVFDALIAYLADGYRGPGFVTLDKSEGEPYDKQYILLTNAGNKRVLQRDVYASFRTSEEYSVRTATGRVGSLDLRAPVAPGQFIALRGRGWEVQWVSLTRKEIRVRPAATGRAPRFPGDPIPVSEMVVRRMSELYEMSDIELARVLETVDLKGEGFKESIEKGRQAYAEAELNQARVLARDGNVLVFPWAGEAKMNAYLAVLRACLLRASAIGPVIILPNITKERLARTMQTHSALLRRLKDRPEELVRDFISRPNGKFDDVLAPYFWRYDFVSNRLDPDGVEEAISVLTSPGA